MLFYLDTAVPPPERRRQCRAGKNVGPTQTGGFTLATAGRPKRKSRYICRVQIPKWKSRV